MKKFLVLMGLIILGCALVWADIRIKTKTHIDAITIMGQTQPEKNEVTEQWLAEDRYAVHGQDNSVILDLKKNMLYFLDHQDKSYVETTLPLDLTKLFPPEMAQMMTMMKMTVTVNPTGQTKTIGSWKCSGYEVNISMMMMPMKMMVWASTDVPFDVNRFMERFYSHILKLQLRLDDQSLAEMQKIKGYWIASETTGEVMGAKIRGTMEVTEISQASPPPNVYSIPANYRKTDKLKIR
ncbi:MAG: hypothetical protein N3B16_00605 [Candidatus Aminicenantes bacterium]|nr:hypothetical protein [Candidatus Aminicenantes bacterium]